MHAAAPLIDSNAELRERYAALEQTNEQLRRIDESLMDRVKRETGLQDRELGTPMNSVIGLLEDRSHYDRKFAWRQYE